MVLEWLFTLCRVVVGLVFCISAYLKYRSIDSFEIYLYSLDWFPIVLCFYFARLLIVFEFVLGVALVSHVFRKLVDWASYAVLFLFSIFLVYLISQGYEGNCHCMGNYIDLPPIPSLIKNVVLGALIWLSGKGKKFSFKWLNIAVPIIGVVTLAAVFISNPPDGLRKTKPADIHLSEIDKYFPTDSVFQAEYASKPKALVCCFSTGCRVCRLSAQKMQIMMNRFSIPSDRVYTLYVGSEHKRKVFMEKTNFGEYRYKILDVEQFSRMFGHVPVFLYYENGVLKNSFTYRSLTEDVISSLAD